MNKSEFVGLYQQNKFGIVLEYKCEFQFLSSFITSLVCAYLSITFNNFNSVILFMYSTPQQSLLKKSHKNQITKQKKNQLRYFYSLHLFLNYIYSNSVILFMHSITPSILFAKIHIKKMKKTKYDEKAPQVGGIILRVENLIQVSSFDSTHVKFYSRQSPMITPSPCKKEYVT